MFAIGQTLKVHSLVATFKGISEYGHGVVQFSDNTVRSYRMEDLADMNPIRPKRAPRMASGIEGIYVRGQHVSAQDVARAHKLTTYAIEDTDSAIGWVSDDMEDLHQEAVVDIALLAGAQRARAARLMGTGSLSTVHAYAQVSA